MAKENKPLLRRQKGWKGYVQSWNNYCDNGSYDDMEWGEGTKKPKEVTHDKMGKEIQKW
jgi:hypothetical protein